MLHTLSVRGRTRLKNEDNTEAIVVSSADTLFEGRILRQKVAQICVEVLFQTPTNNKILEVVTQLDAPKLELEQLLGQC